MNAVSLKTMKTLVITIISLITVMTQMTTQAQVKVAFIKVYTPNCDLLFLEPEFEYSHVAISYKDGWLNAHPKHGVQFTKTIDELDFPKIEYSILESVLMPEVLPEDIIAGNTQYQGRYLQVKDLIGKDYDKNYTWNSGGSYYCSELVAKILGVKPRAMVFNPEIWPKRYQKLNGRPGISPSLLLEEMLRRGFLPLTGASF